jgi:hypothetical protein
MLPLTQHSNIKLESMLEVEKLAEINKQNASGSEFDFLHSEIINNKKIEESENSSIYNKDTENDNNDINTDEDTLSQESFRNLTYSELSLESYEFNTEPTTVSKLGSKVSEAFKSSIDYLSYLGITYGPTIAKNVYKGVIFIMGKLTKLLLSSIVTLTKYLNRRINSFNKLKSDIDDAKKVLKELNGKELSIDKKIKYTNVKIINTLKISDSVDFINNINTVNSFVSKTINEINTSINNDIGSVKYLISASLLNTIKNPINILIKDIPLNGMSSNVIEGYEPKDDTINGYISNYDLPGDVCLVAHLPKKDINTMEEIIRAYNNSSLFLAMNIKKFKSIESVDYMSIEDLNEYLTVLSKLCNTCILHQSLYEAVIKNKSSLRYNFKQYFNQIFNSNEKVSVSNSLIEYIYLKYMFTDKVYLTAAMDIHDYSIKIINNSLLFIKSNIKQYV